MCGIAGIIDSKGNNIDRPLLKAMCDTMVHRGPDDEGIYINEVKSEGLRVRVGLGHRRLSIIDLSHAGHQPMSNEDGSVWIVMNGEIYNFQELRAGLEAKGHRFKSGTDTEVILHLYEDKGEDCVSDLRGMFSFAIWDERQGKLILARDRIGKKPLLYALVNEKLVFASEFRALLKHPDIGREIDYEAIHHYLTYLCIPAPLTAFKKIRKLPAAHILIWQNGKIKIQNYWELDFSKKIKINEHDASQEILRLLRDSVSVRLASDVPLGALLSGGVDSSCVTAFMSQLKGKDVRTFSVGFDDNQFNELPYAKLVADYFATRHIQEYVTPDIMRVLPEIVGHYGEPFGDSSALPTYYVCKAASRKVKVALNGDGGDEVFGGYRRHLANYMAEAYGPMAKALNRSPLKMFFRMFPDRPSKPNSLGSVRRFLDAAELDRSQRYIRWIGFFSEEFKRDIYTAGFNAKTRAMDSSVFLTELFSKANGLDSIDAALCIDTLFGLQADLLVKMDIASMANSLETRSPLLDQSIMEFMASLPSDLKIHNFKLKYIFKKSLHSLVPDRILKRPKRGFAVPVDRWFRRPLREYLIKTILSEKALDRGYFEPDKLRRVVEAHVSYRNDYGQHLWGLLVLELWHRRFIDA